jgi:hypothetical protein
MLMTTGMVQRHVDWQTTMPVKNMDSDVREI